MLSVEMMVSRAANDEMSPMPIFQSKPRGLIVGSINRPARPAKLFSICVAPALEVGFPWLVRFRGNAVKAQSRIEIERITVPARCRKTPDRVSKALPTLRRFGSRYGGSSMTNGGAG